MTTVTFRASAQSLSELEQCEYGSYEDHILDDERLGEYADGRLHIVEILARTGKGSIKMYNQAEIDEVFTQAVTGTWSLRCPRQTQRLYDELKELVSDEVKATWAYTSPSIGY